MSREERQQRDLEQMPKKKGRSSPEQGGPSSQKDISFNTDEKYENSI